MSLKQREKLKELFESQRNEWIPLPRILGMGIAQYNARIFELRREGMNIENKIEWVDSEKHSWFRNTTKEEQLVWK